MSIRIFVDDKITEDGKYRVLQEDSNSKESFGVKDFDTLEEAQRTADDMQRAADNAVSEDITLRNIEIPLEDNSDLTVKNQFKDTLQDLKDETSQE